MKPALSWQAADQDDSHEKDVVTPGPILPAREVLDDKLLQVVQPILALQAYEAADSLRRGMMHAGEYRVK